MKFRDQTNAEVAQYKGKIDLLIITATPVETEAALFVFRPFPEEHELIKCYFSDTYTLGVFGRYGAVHVQCNSMGSGSRQGSALTTSDAIDIWAPKAIIMVGIAFGKDNQKQKLKDILVSESIIPYEFARIGETEKVSRALIASSGPTLFERAKVINRFNDGDVKVHYGKVLSGEKVIDSEEFKEGLFNIYSEAIGGEMEGAGLYAACSRRGVSEWLLVKSICDWGDGQKTKEFQKPAAETAVAFVQKIFQSKSAFENLNFTPLEILEEITIVPETMPEIDQFLMGIENKLWRDSEEARENVQKLIQELCHNAFMHGGAKTCILDSDNNGITLKFDGIKFNLKDICQDNLSRGGSHTLSFILENHDDTVEYEYNYFNDENIVYLKDISGRLMDFIVQANCSVEITKGEYRELNRNLFLDRKIHVPEDCDAIFVDLTNVNIGSLVSRISSSDNGIIKEIRSRIPGNTNLKVRIKGNRIARSFFSQYENDKSIIIEYV